MGEKPAAVEHQYSAEQREQVCAECTDARAGLNHLILAEQVANPEQRRAELSAWLSQNLPDCQPTDLAFEIAMQIEHDEATAGFPGFRIDDLPVDELREELQVYLAEAQAEDRNENTTGQIDDGVPAKVPAEVGQESKLLRDETRLEEDRHALQSERAETADLKTQRLDKALEGEGQTQELKRLQSAFNRLRAEGIGTAEALRQVIAQAQNPETKQHLNAILIRVAMLQTALPDKPDAVNRLLNTSGLNLAAATVTGSFADFKTAADADEMLTADDRASLRRIIEGGDRQLKTGTQVREAALATTIDPATGEAVALHTANNKAEVAPGVFTYTETGQNVILEISEGNLRRQIDVTGLDGVSIGILAEIMGVAALAASDGAGGFIKHVYGVDFDRLADQAVDPITLNGVRQKLTHLIGTGHDGEILQPEQQRALLETQMRLVSPNGSLLAWEDDPDGYRANVEALGLDHAPVLEAFGTYTQFHTGTVNQDDLQRHLHRNFPQIVALPGEDSGDIAA